MKRTTTSRIAHVLAALVLLLPAAVPAQKAERLESPNRPSAREVVAPKDKPPTGQGASVAKKR